MAHASMIHSGNHIIVNVQKDGRGDIAKRRQSLVPKNHVFMAHALIHRMVQFVHAHLDTVENIVMFKRTIVNQIRAKMVANVRVLSVVFSAPVQPDLRVKHAK